MGGSGIGGSGMGGSGMGGSGMGDPGWGIRDSGSGMAIRDQGFKLFIVE
jgi:hypothetical protein